MIEDLLSEAEGELTPEIEQRMAELLKGGADKIENAACIVKSLQSQSDACREEIFRLQARQRALEANLTRLKELMLAAVDNGFGGKVKTPLFTVWGQNSAKTVNFSLPDEKDFDIWQVPEEYLRVEPELDKAKLQQLHKAGQELPVCIIVKEIPGTRFLQIR